MFGLLFLAASVALAAPLASIQRLENGWARSFNSGDGAAVSALYDQDAWLVLPGRLPVRGRSAILMTLTGLADQAVDLSLRTDSVRPLGNGYLVENGVAQYEARGAKPGNAQVTANYQVIWKRSAGGSWTIVRDVVTPL